MNCVSAPQPLLIAALLHAADTVGGTFLATLLAARKLAVLEDSAFLQGAGSQFTPKGIMTSAATSTASGDVKNTGLLILTLAVLSAEASPFKSAITSAAVEPVAGRDFLATLVSSSGQFQFRSVDNGTLMGFPLVYTTAPSGVVILCDMSDFYIGAAGMEISTRNAATYTLADGSTKVSTFDRIRQDDAMARAAAAWAGGQKMLATRARNRAAR